MAMQACGCGIRTKGRSPPSIFRIKKLIDRIELHQETKIQQGTHLNFAKRGYFIIRNPQGVLPAIHKTLHESDVSPRSGKGEALFGLAKASKRRNTTDLRAHHGRTERDKSCHTKHLVTTPL